MNQRIFAAICFAVVAILLPVSATNIALIGQVVDANGTPIQGANISVGAIQTVSDEDGNFGIIGSVNEQAPSLAPPAATAPNIKGNLLNFSTAGKADLKIFDVRGRVVESKTLGAGQYSLNVFPGTISANGFYLVRLSIDDRCFIFKKTKMAQSQSADLVIESSGNTLAKKSSPAGKAEMTIGVNGFTKTIVINPYLNDELGYVGALGNVVFSSVSSPNSANGLNLLNIVTIRVSAGTALSAGGGKVGADVSGSAVGIQASGGETGAYLSGNSIGSQSIGGDRGSYSRATNPDGIASYVDGKLFVKDALVFGDGQKITSDLVAELKTAIKEVNALKAALSKKK